MSDKAYITFHYEESDGSEIKVKDALFTDAATIGELFERFLDFLVSMSFTEEQIARIVKEWADEYHAYSDYEGQDLKKAKKEYFAVRRR